MHKYNKLLSVLIYTNVKYMTVPYTELCQKRCSQVLNAWSAFCKYIGDWYGGID